MSHVCIKCSLFTARKKNLAAYGVKLGGLGGLFAGGVPSLKKTRNTPIEEPTDQHKKEESQGHEFPLRKSTGHQSEVAEPVASNKEKKLASPPVVNFVLLSPKSCINFTI